VPKDEMASYVKKVGVIADVHANRPALEAALAALNHVGCDLIVHVGDAIGIGPHPAEVLGILLEAKNMRFVRGNHDDYFVSGLPETSTSWMDDEELEHQLWTHRQLSPAMRDAMRTWPFSSKLAVNGVQAWFCHYARDISGGGFAPIIPQPHARVLDNLFQPNSAEVVFYGHDHSRSDVRGQARYINPGALGCGSAGMARYAILGVTTDGDWDVEFGGAPYDVSEVLNDLETRRVPARALIKRAFYGQNA
jgi:putative phosphoesterase